MIAEKFSRARNQRQEQPPIRECNFQQRSPHGKYHPMSLPKPFPNMYSSLALRPEYMPSESPIFIGSHATTLLARTPVLTNGNQDGNEPCLMGSSHEMRLAGMKIFATIMLNAWRRRRDDVKRLLTKVEELKKGSMKAKNQIHVYNTLFRVEQKRNDDLACQLKRSLESIIQAKSSCEGLTTSVISLKADRALLEQELQNKYKEIDAINDILSQTKSDLFQSMMEQRTLRAALVKEQRTVQSLENHKNQLINELCQLGNENRGVEEKYRNELAKKDADLCQAQATLKELESQLLELRSKANAVDACMLNDSRLRLEIRELQKRVNSLQSSLQKTMGNRMSRMWQKTCTYEKKTWHWLHFFAYILLPAMPLPDLADIKANLFTSNYNIDYS